MTLKPVFSEGLFTLRNIRSVGAAAVIEILIGAGIAGLLIWQQLQPHLDLPPVVRDPGVVIPDQPIPQPHKTLVPESQTPQPMPFHEVPPVPTDVPDVNTQKVLPPQPPLVPEQGREQPDLVGSFTAHMLQAINAQKVYPRVSMLKGETGEVAVSFDYVDGVVSGVRVDRSSGSHDLDKAAIEAVQRAALPPKPAELAGLRHFAFTLVFDLGT